MKNKIVKNLTSVDTPEYNALCKTTENILNVRVTVRTTLDARIAEGLIHEAAIRAAASQSWRMAKHRLEVLHYRLNMNKLTVVTAIDASGNPVGTYELLGVVPSSDGRRYDFILGNKLDADLDYIYAFKRGFYNPQFDIEETI